MKEEFTDEIYRKDPGAITSQKTLFACKYLKILHFKVCELGGGVEWSIEYVKIAMKNF